MHGLGRYLERLDEKRFDENRQDDRPQQKHGHLRHRRLEPPTGASRCRLHTVGVRRFLLLGVRDGNREDAFRLSFGQSRLSFMRADLPERPRR